MQRKKTDLSGLVYSTDPNFKLPEEEPEEALTPNKQDLRIWLEKNHRGGKVATVIRDYKGSQQEMDALCKELKSKCGTGGSAKDGEIIIQGDHRKKVSELLTKMGYKNKLAGA